VRRAREAVLSHSSLRELIKDAILMLKASGIWGISVQNWQESDEYQLTEFSQPPHEDVVQAERIRDCR
jgi:hypothetical protein